MSNGVYADVQIVRLEPSSNQRIVLVDLRWTKGRGYLGIAPTYSPMQWALSEVRSDAHVFSGSLAVIGGLKAWAAERGYRLWFGENDTIQIVNDANSRMNDMAMAEALKEARDNS